MNRNKNGKLSGIKFCIWTDVEKNRLVELKRTINDLEQESFRNYDLIPEIQLEEDGLTTSLEFFYPEIKRTIILLKNFLYKQKINKNIHTNCIDQVNNETTVYGRENNLHLMAKNVASVVSKPSEQYDLSTLASKIKIVGAFTMYTSLGRLGYQFGILSNFALMIFYF